MKANNTNTPALSTDDDSQYQNLQGRYWIALAEGDTAQAKKINKQIAKMRKGKGGLLAKLMGAK